MTTQYPRVDEGRYNGGADRYKYCSRSNNVAIAPEEASGAGVMLVGRRQVAHERLLEQCWWGQDVGVVELSAGGRERKGLV